MILQANVARADKLRACPTPVYDKLSACRREHPRRVEIPSLTMPFELRLLHEIEIESRRVRRPAFGGVVADGDRQRRYAGDVHPGPRRNLDRFVTGAE